MKIQVLDHGYVQFVEAWGHGIAGIEEGNWPESIADKEIGIIEAARQSTQGSFRGWEPPECDCEKVFDMHDGGCSIWLHKGDAALLKYLFSHNHSTPFEFAGLVIEVQAPIFVFREWQRHRTQSYNEMSARYEPLPDLYYIPSVERLMMIQTGNKQAEALYGKPHITQLVAEQWREELINAYRVCENAYQLGLCNGVPKELARAIMPVGHYSRMRASASLRNWLAFLTLRLDPAAQWEIRQFATAVGQIIAEQFPRTWKLFEEKKNV